MPRRSKRLASERSSGDCESHQSSHDAAAAAAVNSASKCARRAPPCVRRAASASSLPWISTKLLPLPLRCTNCRIESLSQGRLQWRVTSHMSQHSRLQWLSLPDVAQCRRGGTSPCVAKLIGRSEHANGHVPDALVLCGGEGEQHVRSGHPWVYENVGVKVRTRG
jgi:hypothetical protein